MKNIKSINLEIRENGIERAKIKYKNQVTQVSQAISKLEKTFGKKVPILELDKTLDKKIIDCGSEILMCSGEIFHPDGNHVMRVIHVPGVNSK